MSAIILHRTDPMKNMRRFYRLDVQRDLFGQWCFIREWGRIGRAGQVREVAYATAGEAHEALAMQWRMKERRGYSVPIRSRELDFFNARTNCPKWTPAPTNRAAALNNAAEAAINSVALVIPSIISTVPSRKAA